MNILFFYTETNGKPKRYNASMADVNNWPRITQLAWLIADDDTGIVVLSHQSLIKPNGWTIPKEDFFIKNNMSTERCEANGNPLVAILKKLIDQINDHKVDIIVAHNIAFDINVLGAEMIRIKMKVGRKMSQVCTMVNGTEMCKLPGNYGEYKWPKLSELYNHLFQKDFEGAHDALNDVHACKECFFELVKRGVIELNKKVTSS